MPVETQVQRVSLVEQRSATAQTPSSPRPQLRTVAEPVAAPTRWGHPSQAALEVGASKRELQGTPEPPRATPATTPETRQAPEDRSELGSEDRTPKLSTGQALPCMGCVGAEESS